MTSYTKTELINLEIIDAEEIDENDRNYPPESIFEGEDGVTYHIISEPSDAEITHQLLIEQLENQKMIDSKLQFLNRLAIAGVLAFIAVSVLLLTKLG